jgi:hypothetical protein
MLGATKKELGLVTGFIGHLQMRLGTTSNYGTIADFYTSQAHAKYSRSNFPSRFLATSFNNYFSFFFFFTYFTDAQCVHLWLHGRHLYDSPFYPTRVSAYHSRPGPLFIVLCTYYFMFAFYCILLYYIIVLLYRFCMY